MRAELDVQTSEQLIVRTGEVHEFKNFKNKVNDAGRRLIHNKRGTINNPSRMNNNVQQAFAIKRRAYKATEGTTVSKCRIYWSYRRQVKIIIKPEKRNEKQFWSCT